MSPPRAALEVEDLLKIILVLVALWLVLEVVNTLVETTLAVLAFFKPLIGLVVVVLIVLWLLDRI
ncbi:MAG: hypothetical protein ABEJ08_00330 [Halobacteriaceae archaeon]